MQEILSSFGIFSFSTFLFSDAVFREGYAIFPQQCVHLLHAGNIGIQNLADFLRPAFGVKGIDSSEQILQFAFLFGQSGHLLKYAGRDMVAPGQAGALATLQIWKLLDHVFPKLILPPGQLLFIAHDVFGAEPAILRQRDKTKVHMGRFLVHMHHGGYNCLFGLMLFQKSAELPRKIPEFPPVSFP